MFRDRTDAGEQLADLVKQREIDADIVLAIPRGGLPLGRAVADELDAPLDVIVSKKIGAPRNPELAVGAAASDGSIWLNDDLIDRLGLDPEQVRTDGQRVAQQAREKAQQYRGDRPAPDLAGKDVLVVDDGVATGATMISCARLAREAGAAHVTIAVPVGPPNSIEALHAEADDVVCPQTPPHFQAVGQFYDSFRQVSDDEAMAYLTDERSRNSETFK